MHGARIALGLVAAVLAGWWIYATPPRHHVIADAYVLGATPPAILAVKTATDVIAASAERWPSQLPGHDEVILQEHLGRAFVTASDGWIWRFDLKTRQGEHFVATPMSPAGARAVPGDDDRILFCATRLDSNVYPDSVQPGIYELRISTREVRPVALRVPLPPPIAPARHGNLGTVFPPDLSPGVSLSALAGTNSRQIAFCNDIDISRDGQRIYMSEPFDYPGAASGTGAIAEAITLARNGRLWMFDREHDTVRLVAQNYNFVDGVLLEYGAAAVEESILITETPKFRIDRLYLRGPKAGTDEGLWENLPGMPDGLDRVSEGRMWVGLLKERSGFVNWVHANPWIKPLLLRLPPGLLPTKKATGMIAFSPDAATPLFYTWHAGSMLSDIPVVVPGRERLYLPSFARDNAGLVSMPYPAQVPPPTISKAALAGESAGR